MSFIIKTREKTITENGTKILYGINKNKSKNKADIATIREFFSKRIYKNEGILEADAGIYTWILKNGPPKNLYIAKTFTKQELGTLHVNLDDLTKPSNDSNIVAAGELEILEDGHINFNLLSGTYMVPKFKKKNNAGKMELRDKIVEEFKNLLNTRYGIDATFIESNNSEEEKLGGKKIIESTNIKTSSDNIKMLNGLFIRKEEEKAGKEGGRRLKYTYTKRRGMKNRRTRKRV
jgi:hypothetical protein